MKGDRPWDNLRRHLTSASWHQIQKPESSSLQSLERDGHEIDIRTGYIAGKATRGRTQPRQPALTAMGKESRPKAQHHGREPVDPRSRTCRLTDSKTPRLSKAERRRFLSQRPSSASVAFFLFCHRFGRDHVHGPQWQTSGHTRPHADGGET
jgi:hypothetical protein